MPDDVVGDLDVNPGRTVEEMLEAVLSVENKITSEIAALQTAQKDIILKLKGQWALRLAKENNGQLGETLGKRQIVFIHAKITDLEYKSSRRNLVVFRVYEDPAETEPDFKRKVLTEIFGEKLNISSRCLGRIQRIENSEPDKQRQGIIFF